MGIENLKRWHWIVLSLLVGVGFGWFWSQPGTDASDVGRTSQLDFESRLLRTDNTGTPLVSNISIDPPTVDYRGQQIQIVNYKLLERGAKSGKTYEVDKQFIATIPYRPFFRSISRNSKGIHDDYSMLLSELGKKYPRLDPSFFAQGDLPAGVAAPHAGPFTLADYLVTIKKQNPELAWSNSWWKTPPAMMGIFAVISLVVIGGIWPTILNLLTGAGLGPKPKPKAAEAPSSGESTAATMPARSVPVASEAQRAELDDINRQLEEQLQAAGVLTNIDPNAPQEEDPDGPILAPPTVRQLSGVAADPVPVGSKKPEEEDDVEVKGEFYPVLIHHKKEK